MMGLLSTLVSGQLAQPIEAVGNVVDKLFTSDDERLSHKEVQQRLAMQPQLAQVELNKVEAQHRSMFVAGWRPAIGWVCALGLLFMFVLNPCIQWFTGAPGPELPGEVIASLVTSLLGLGALRTFEKTVGRAK